MRINKLPLSTALLLAALVPLTAPAQVVVTSTNNINTLISALLAPSSGITIVPGSATLLGGPNQSGTYDTFNLAPSAGSSPTLALPAGITLTSGSAQPGTTNLTNETTVNTGTGGFAALTTLAGSSTFNANVLTFDFTVNPGITSISAQFLFATEEFPTQSVTDIFGFFVDGVNYAKFPNGDLIANTPGNPTNFISNPVGAGLYPILYNGLTPVFSVTGLLDTNVTTHRVTIGIADTFDTRFDSAVFIGALKAGTTTTGGGINPNPNPVPDSGPMLVLLGGAFAALAAFRRRFAR